MTTLIGICTKHDRSGFEKTTTYKHMFEDFSVEDRNDHILYTDTYTHAVIKKNNNIIETYILFIKFILYFDV